MGDDEYPVSIPHSPQSIMQLEDAAIDLMAVLCADYRKRDLSRLNITAEEFVKAMLDNLVATAIAKSRKQ